MISVSNKTFVIFLPISYQSLTYSEVFGQMLEVMLQIERVDAQSIFKFLSVFHPHTATIKVSEHPLVRIELQ